jgi:hypothetical protein
MECEFDPQSLLNDPDSWQEQALHTFRYQYENNSLYRAYVQLVKGTHFSPEQLRFVHEIPFLPISFFKTHSIKTGQWETSLVFESSGTTGMQVSRHELPHPFGYEKSFLQAFQLFYGNPNDWCIIGLLPAYLERQHSSLVYMVNHLIQLSNHPQSGFYLNNFEDLHQVLQQNEKAGVKTWLIGVTFALTDFATAYPMELHHTVVVETGGMKGRKRELTRAEIHQLLQSQWKLSQVEAEYGMTELCSQAYARHNGRFMTPPWMKVLLRPEDDPLFTHPVGTTTTGVINVMDLANVHSCSFIATDDRGECHADGSFSVLGRVDHSDIRGCALLYIN